MFRVAGDPTTTLGSRSPMQPESLKPLVILLLESLYFGGKRLRKAKSNIDAGEDGPEDRPLHELEWEQHGLDELTHVNSSPSPFPLQHALAEAASRQKRIELMGGSNRWTLSLHSTQASALMTKLVAETDACFSKCVATIPVIA